MVVITRYFISKEKIVFLIVKLNKRWKLFFEVCLTGLILIYLLFVLFFGVGELIFKLNLSSKVLLVFISYLFGYKAVSLFEELLFRDYLLMKFKDKYSISDAVFLSSLLFSLLHIISYISVGSQPILGY